MAILDFRSERFIFFYLQVTPMLPTKLQVNLPFGSGKEAKIEFQDCRHSGNFGFPIGTILSFFLLINKSPRCSLLSFKSISLSAQEMKQKKIFKMAAMAAIMDFRSDQF